MNDMLLGMPVSSTNAESRFAHSSEELSEICVVLFQRLFKYK